MGDVTLQSVKTEAGCVAVDRDTEELAEGTSPRTGGTEQALTSKCRWELILGF